MTEKKFIAKVVLIILIALVIPFLEVILPAERFAFRGWEAVLLQRRDRFLPGVFYPNQQVDMTEVGDLAPYTEKQVAHPVLWKTDEFGYRNSGDCKNPEVIVLGDSMAAGIALDQADTISEKIKSKTGLCVFSFGHDSIEHALKAMVRWKWKPKHVILVRAERTLPEMDSFPTIENPPKQRKTKFFFQEYGMNLPVTAFERMIHSNFAQYRASHGVWPALKRLLVPYHFETGPHPQMIFFQGERALEPKPADYLVNRANLLEKYKEEFSAWGMKLLVMVVPNKESIYPELIPSSLRSSVVPSIYAELKKRNVDYVDLWQPFRGAYVENKTVLYHLDDTHWTKAGTEAASQLIREKIR